jgi:hypothetical protein
MILFIEVEVKLQWILVVIFGAANGSNSYSGILPELKLFNTTEAPNWARKI